MTRPIQVEVDVKSSAAIGAFAGIGASIAGAGIALVKAGLEAGIEAIGNSIELASDKAEAGSKAQVLFGDSFSIVEEKSKTAATAVGLSSGAYLTAAGNVGNLITNLGFSGDAAAKMSTDIVGLSADLGSFNNLPTDQAVEAIGAAFRGETEPIRAFGVMLDEAAIKAKAVELGLYSGVGALDKNAKATATYQLILEQTTNAQGDFARTSDGLANSQRINAARLEDAWTHVGEKLAPIAQAILPMIADALVNLVDGIAAVIDAIQQWVSDNQDLVDSAVELARMVGQFLVDAFGKVVEILGELGYRIGGVIGLFIDLAGAIIDGGSAIVKVLSGDFEGAAQSAQMSLDRLGSFQENVQRAMGDSARRQADSAAITAAASAQAQQDIWETAGSEAINALAGVPPAYADIGHESGSNLTSSLDSSLTSGLGPVGNAADDLGAQVEQGVSQGAQAAVQVARQTPGELADALRSSRDTWRSALSQLGDDMKNSVSVAGERSELEAALAGKKIARGLASSDPIVRAQAQETSDLIHDRLVQLAAQAVGLGADVGQGIVAGLHSTDASVRSWAGLAARALQDRLQLHSPAKTGPWSEDGGPIEWMRRNGERMIEALDQGLGRTTVRVPQLSTAGAGALGGVGQAPLTINLYGLIGDPVEAGRQIAEALRSYQRASGTE